tara:strand:+ start:29888 stop:31948 length:2061 start_codon:yes stop_codon:yes gene_type:complete
MTLPTVQEFKDAKQDLDDLAEVINSPSIKDVSMREGKNVPTLAKVIKRLNDHAPVRNRGLWLSETTYEANDIWHSSDDVWYVVVQEYVSGVTQQIDIDAKKVFVHQVNIATDAVETVVELRKFEPSKPNQRVYLLGNILQGYGPGWYWYHQADTTSKDNNGTLIVNETGKRLKRLSDGSPLNVAIFGAVPGGDPAANLLAINSCIEAQFLMGGGNPSIGSGQFEVSGTILAMRTVVLVGDGDLPTVIKLADYSNVDIIKSENFDELTGTNSTTDNDLCPYSFGFNNIQINGNKENQEVGGGVKLYGPRLKLDGFMVYNCKGHGLYTEYSDKIGSDDPRGQEEAVIGSVISRDNDGMGWLFRGPHNSIIDNYIGANNGDWGWKNETKKDKYDGNVTLINHLHTYKNGLITGENNESYFGSVTSINYLIVDGGYSEIASSDCQISKVKLIFGGQTNHGVIVSGNFNNIGMMNGSMLLGTSGFSVLRVEGNNNYVGRSRITGQLKNHDGVVVLGSGNQLRNMDVREAKRGLVVEGGLNRVSGILSLCTDSFSYTRPTGTHPGKNRIELDIYQETGNYVVGDRPVDQLDRFDISATGQGNLATHNEIQSDPVPLDVSDIQSLSISHGLLYTPTRQSVGLTRLISSPTDVGFESSNIRVISTDSTNINIELLMHTPAAEGVVGRIGIRVKI